MKYCRYIVHTLIWIVSCLLIYILGVGITCACSITSCFWGCLLVVRTAYCGVTYKYNTCIHYITWAVQERLKIPNMVKRMNMMICHDKNDDFGQWPKIRRKFIITIQGTGMESAQLSLLCLNILFLKAEYHALSVR